MVKREPIQFEFEFVVRVLAERDNLKRLLKLAVASRDWKAFAKTPEQELWREIEAEVLK